MSSAELILECRTADGHLFRRRATLATLAEFLAAYRAVPMIEARGIAKLDDDEETVLSIERSLRAAIQATLVEYGFGVRNSYLTIRESSFGLCIHVSAPGRESRYR